MRTIKLLSIYISLIVGFWACNQNIEQVGYVFTDAVEFENDRVVILENIDTAYIPMYLSAFAKENVEVKVKVYPRVESTARQDTHFILPQKTIIIPKGSSSVLVPVMPINDTIVNKDRQFDLYIESVNGAEKSIIAQLCRVVIENDDQWPLIGFADATTNITNRYDQVRIPISALGIFYEKAQAELVVTSGTAIEGEHFNIEEKSFVFTKNDKERFIVVNILTDLATNLEFELELQTDLDHYALPGKHAKTKVMLQKLPKTTILAIPDFADSYVYNVVFGAQKVGEFCKEYIPSYSKTEPAIVYYKYDAINNTYSDGIVMVNGGKVAHDGTGYQAGSTPFTSITIDTDTIQSFGNAAPAGTDGKCVADKVVDLEKNTYKITKIGTQYWMAENLATLKYRDDTPIVTNQTPANMDGALNQKIAAAVVYGNLDANAVSGAENREKYGVLYNALVIKTDKLAPKGWHVSTLADWNGMLNYVLGLSEKLDANGAAGTVFTANGLFHDQSWITSTNLTGFSGLPGGYRNNNTFTGINTSAYFWVYPPQYDAQRLNSFVFDNNGNIKRQYDANGRCMSVRCVRN